MTTLQSIGTKLKSQRKALNLAQSDLAARSKVHRNTIGSLESGTGNVELTTLIAICNELGLELVVVPKAVADMATQDGPLQRSARSLKRERILRAAPGAK